MTSEAIVEDLEEFMSHIREAQTRGMTVRSHACSKCSGILSVEFPGLHTERQSKFVQCPCGSIERAIYTP